MNILPCQWTDIACLCSFATANQFEISGCSLYTAAIQTIGPATLDASPTTTHTPVASTTSSSAPPNTPSTAANSRPLPSIPTPTTTETASINDASSDASSGNSGGHRSSSLASQQFPPVPSSSAGAIVDVSATGPLALSSSATVTVSLPLSSSTSPPPSSPHRVDIGTIVAIALSALAVLLASALALFFLCRRGRRPRSRTESRRTSVGSSQRRLEPYVYRGRSSRRLSSVWTGFGSVSVDPDFDPRPEPWRRSESGSLGFPFAEKPEPDQIHRGSAIACAPGASSSSYASRCPSPASAEARPLVRDPSVLSLHEGVAARYLGIGIHIQPLSALHASSTSPELPVLSGADYATANPANWSGGNSGWRES